MGLRLRVAQARELVARGFAVAAVARVLQISRQALYRTPTPRTPPQRRPPADPVEQAIVEEALANQADGYRMITAFVRRKGKVEPGQYRAYGYQPPSHAWADIKLKWREFRLGLGVPPRGSSPAEQQKLGLNRDATLSPKASARGTPTGDGGAIP